MTPRHFLFRNTIYISAGQLKWPTNPMKNVILGINIYYKSVANWRWSEFAQYKFRVNRGLSGGSLNAI